jgi:DNA-binding NarL/FixJ family response regulator
MAMLWAKNDLSRDYSENIIETLIVDDSPSIRKHLHQLIDSMDGMHVVADAASGLEAMHLMKQHQPQLVLIDLEMAGLDSLQATQLIHDFFPRTRVVITAIHESQEVEAACLANGADAFVCKSQIHKKLRGLVNRLFDNGISENKYEL